MVVTGFGPGAATPVCVTWFDVGDRLVMKESFPAAALTKDLL